MSAPSPRSLPEPNRKWIVEFSRLQLKADRRVDQALEDALEQVDRSLRGLKGKPGVGARVRASQLATSRSALSKIVTQSFRSVKSIVKDEQSSAASLAESLLIKEERGIWRELIPDKTSRGRAILDMQAQASRQIQATMARIFQSERPLGARIYRSEALAKNQVSRTIDRHIAIGSSAQDMAKDLRALVDPKVSGGVSYRAKLLARTEINNAFHAQSISDARERPWISQVRWNLSKSHYEEGCVCEEYARAEFFGVNEVPLKPHPQCMCSITPEIPDLSAVMGAFLSGEYGSWAPGSGIV